MNRIDQAWQTRGVIACVLWPLTLIYRVITSCRRFAYHKGWFATPPLPLPVVVVGNLSVGGTGKTPLCAHLVSVFREAGWRPGIVSRGYGGERRELPHLIVDSDTPSSVGDEPLMLFKQTAVPVCVCVKRALAVLHLAESTDVDIVFADDGLQHLAMSRVAEIIVVDGKRGLGNGWLLPAGPLREPANRLSHADVIAVQSTDGLHGTLKKAAQSQQLTELEENYFQLTLNDAVSINDGQRVNLQSFVGKPMMAMAGIGHPKRFFDALRSLGLQVNGIALPDHHVFTLEDFNSVDMSSPVLVTSKDAVKLRALGVLPVNIFEVAATVVVSDNLQSCIADLERSLRNPVNAG